MADTVTITYNGVEMEVTGEYYGGCRGVHTFRNGDPGYPDEPAEFEIESIKIGDVEVLSLFDDMAVRKIRVLGGSYYEEVFLEIEDLCIDAMKGMMHDDYEGD